MIEAITSNLIAASIASGASIGIKQVRDILRRNEFSDEIGPLATEFNKSLRDAIMSSTESLSVNHEGMSPDRISNKWDDIAAEINEINIVFESEKEAVIKVTESVGQALDVDLDQNPEVRKALENAVAEAYGDAVNDFFERVAGTELAEVLRMEANIEIQEAINHIDERLSNLQSRIDQQLERELRDEGFIRLTPLYFEQRSPDPPEQCWRTGFELVEVGEGYPVAREAKSDDGSRYRISEVLIDELATENDCVVLGPPGSGKSTVCKQVAYNWYKKEYGTVYYRSSTQSKPLTNPGPLEESIRNEEDDVLVVVEDAVREEANDIFHVIHRLRHHNAVSFLLDSRLEEWHNSDTSFSSARLQELKEGAIEHYEVPPLDETECERIIDHFESTTGTTVRESGGDLSNKIDTESGVGGVLQLSYHLSFYAKEPLSEDRLSDGHTSKGITSLEKTVQNSFQEHREMSFEDMELDNFPLKVGVLVNILNASDIGVYPELLHTLARDREEHRTISQILNRYEGELIFTADAESAGDTTSMLRAQHEFWSTLYLEEVLEQLGERQGAEVFESCINRLLGVFDDANHRKRINRWFRMEMPLISEIEKNSKETADSFVESIFALGRRRPVLAPLFGRTDFSLIELPSSCSVALQARTALWRGIMYYQAGEIDTAELEFETCQEEAENISEITQEVREELKAWSLSYLGIIESDRGDISSGKNHLHQSHELFCNIDNRQGEAHSLFYISYLNREEGEFDESEQYLNSALDIYRELGNRSKVAHCLNMLGVLENHRGNFNGAEEFLRESLEISREVGATRNEARTLNHLGITELSRGEFDKAKSAFQQGLKVAEKIGDKQGRAYLVHNLGDLARSQGNLSTAESYFRESLQIEKQIGNLRGEAISYNYIGDVLRNQGELDEAENLLEQGLDLIREVGDQRREGEILKTRGLLAKDRGDFREAEVLLEESLDLYQLVGDKQGEGKVYQELGNVALKQGDLEKAKELYKHSRDINKNINYREGVARCIGSLGIVAQRQGEYSRAEERYEDSLDLMRNLGDKEGEAYSLMRLGDLAREQGNYRSASEFQENSRDLFTSIGDRRRVAQTWQRQGQAEREAGNFSVAAECLENAIDMFGDIGDKFGVARTIAEKGLLNRDNGSYKEADHHLMEAVELYREIGDVNEALKYLEELITLRQQKGGDVTEVRSIAQSLKDSSGQD